MRKPIILSLMFYVAACGSGGDQKRERPTPLVTVGAASSYAFSDRYVAVGTANANEQVSVRAPVTERITQLGFSDGDYVQKGQMLAVLAQGQETASLASAQARSREADQQLARISELHRRGFATNASLEAQTATAAAAKAVANEARASIGDRVVRAPFSGQVSLRRISVGAVVSAGDEIAVVSDLSSIKLDFTVPETMLSNVRVGQEISAKAAAFPDYLATGKITAIDPVINPQTRTVTLRAILPNRSAMLKPGMLLSVTITSNTRTAPAVPELSLVREGDTSFVYTVGTDLKVKRTPVKTGARDGKFVEVVEGINVGDKIVTEGIVKLSDGATVRTGPAKAGGGPATAR
ncbi:efflux RND transporter periplasmic adaptor subunit [Sphingorhabdus sp.]|uniref:efflux RND transporter periplasmic adaptor subunit n=1 Tax=Sphingorhabdus sp. TaxID=1902408 RepID=UPI003919D976